MHKGMSRRGNRRKPVKPEGYRGKPKGGNDSRSFGFSRKWSAFDREDIIYIISTVSMAGGHSYYI
jgi:hypothetical protein